MHGKRNTMPMPLRAKLTIAAIVAVVLIALIVGIYFGVTIHAAGSTITPSPTTTPTVTQTDPLFTLVKSWTGLQIVQSIGTDFSYFTSTDPTHGYVNYAGHAGLVTVEGSNMRIEMGQNMGGPRNSVRLQSTATYDSGLIVIDIAHIPADNSTWPSFWSSGIVAPPSRWALHGEIDMIEQVNNSSANLCSLHTSKDTSSRYAFILDRYC